MRLAVLVDRGARASEIILGGDDFSVVEALAAALDRLGFDVQAKEFGYTESHQVAVNVRDFRGGERVSKNLEINEPKRSVL